MWSWPSLGSATARSSKVEGNCPYWSIGMMVLVNYCGPRVHRNHNRGVPVVVEKRCRTTSPRRSTAPCLAPVTRGNVLTQSRNHAIHGVEARGPGQ